MVLTVVEILVKEIRKEKEKKKASALKGRSKKLCLSEDNIILYRVNPKESAKKLL